MTSGKGRGSIDELEKHKRGTKGTREAEQEHMRRTTEGQKMYHRGTQDEQQQYQKKYSLYGKKIASLIQGKGAASKCANRPFTINELITRKSVKICRIKKQ